MRRAGLVRRAEARPWSSPGGEGPWPTRFLTPSAISNILRGDTGDDSLWGHEGMDSLYGGLGDDELSGGGSDDALVGGFGEDELTGGSGEDRFLINTWVSDRRRRWEDSVTDLRSGDARLGFQNGSRITTEFAGQDGEYTYSARVWSDADIEEVDKAFAMLHEATGNTRLLKTEDGDETILCRQGVKTSGTGSFTASAWNGGGVIHMSDYAFNASQKAIKTLLHEVGHNWDEEYDEDGWQDLSGWKHRWSWTHAHEGYVQGTDASGDWYYRDWAQFSSDYARTNPNEDFAESFKAFFVHRAGWSTTLINVASKAQFIQNMIDDLA